MQSPEGLEDSPLLLMYVDHVHDLVVLSFSARKSDRLTHFFLARLRIMK